MSDVADGSGPSHGATPRSADGGAPVSGALAIVLAVVAVVAGFFILRSISGDDKKQFDLQSAGTGAPADDGNNGAGHHRPSSSSTPATTIPTTNDARHRRRHGRGRQRQRSRRVGGVDAQALEIGPGFTMGDPADASAPPATSRRRSSTTTPPSPPHSRWRSRSIRAMGGGGPAPAAPGHTADGERRHRRRRRAGDARSRQGRTRHSKNSTRHGRTRRRSAWSPTRRCPRRSRTVSCSRPYGPDAT